MAVKKTVRSCSCHSRVGGFFIFLFTGFLLIAVQGVEVSEAVGNMRLGPFAVHPSLETQAGYTDNVKREERNEDSDTFYLISPGLTLETDREDRKLLFYYKADVEEYADTDSEDAVSHAAHGSAHLDFSSGLMTELEDSYVYTHDERGTNLNIPLDFYAGNVVRGALGYTFADVYTLRGDVSYQCTNYKGVRNAFRDYASVTYSGTFLVQILPRTALLLEVDREKTDFDESGRFDSIEWRYLGGLKWDMTAKSTGTVKVGYGEKDFSRKGQKDYNGLLFEAKIDHNLTPSTKLRAEAKREVNETNQVGANYYTTTGFFAQARHNFTYKVGMDLTASYGEDRYSEPVVLSGISHTRHDKTWRGGLNLRYDVQEWLGLSLGYVRVDRTSNFNVLEYTENQYLLRLAAVL